MQSVKNSKLIERYTLTWKCADIHLRRNIVIIIILPIFVGFQLATKDSTQFISNRVKEAAGVQKYKTVYRNIFRIIYLQLAEYEKKTVPYNLQYSVENIIFILS